MAGCKMACSIVFLSAALAASPSPTCKLEECGAVRGSVQLQLRQVAGRLRDSVLDEADDEDNANLWPQEVQDVQDIALGLQPTPDKFTRHHYQDMYGLFLAPVSTAAAPIKLLEIGLGCDMSYGPGASLAFWKRFLPTAKLWFGEYDAACVEKFKAAGKLDGIGVLVGDQGNVDTVRQWVNTSGGEFDVIVDDGGHHNVQIMTSFEVLWPTLRPGGLYFIEDLQVGRAKGYSNLGPPDQIAVNDVVQAWMEQLLLMPQSVSAASRKHPLPPEVAFILCQREACVLGKEFHTRDPTEVAALEQDAADNKKSEAKDDEDAKDEPLLMEDGTEEEEDANHPITTVATATPGIRTMWPNVWPQGVQDVQNTALGLQPTSDKFTRHHYQDMYGLFLAPVSTAAAPIKLLEIGLGCDMSYGPGASLAFWKRFLPTAKLWFGEYDAACVEKFKAAGKLDGIGVLVGDQGNVDTVRQWVNTSGGEFDVIVDDGGHHNVQIMTSFEVLWPTLRPGGLYFIEDLQVGRAKGYSNLGPPDQIAVNDVVQAWIEQLLLKPQSVSAASRKHPLPPEVAFILCQREACVLGKDAGPEETASSNAR